MLMADGRDSLLAHVAWKFTGQTETLATEALGYILSRSVAAREALREMLRDGGADVAPLVRVATEVIGKKDERLDLVAFDRRGSERVLIEVKFWAGLTSKQPEEYLGRLPRDGDPAVLLFVAPEQRLVTLWAEICRRAGARCELGDDAGIEGLMSVMVDGSPRRLMLTSWRRLLDAMRSRANAAGDSSAVRDILQLGALCERQDQDAFLPLRSEELAPAFPRRMRDMQKLVNDATTRARRGGFVSTKGLRVVPQAHGYGRWLKIGKDGTSFPAWFGVHHGLWVRQKETPLWLCFSNRQWSLVKEKLSDQNYGFTLCVGVEYGEVLDSVVGQLEEIANALSG
ncbi:MAG: hypothetical protein F4X74_02755 [Acidimicrobiia bacterium]|nr:hypothetical protein [Acidimicrobiia bacterium]